MTGGYYYTREAHLGCVAFMRSSQGGNTGPGMTHGICSKIGGKWVVSSKERDSCIHSGAAPFWGIKAEYGAYNDTTIATNAAKTTTPVSSMWNSGFSACCLHFGSSNPQARDCWEWSLGVDMTEEKCLKCG